MSDSLVGRPIPPSDRHAISVSLPTWEDTIGWSSRDQRVLNAMKTGYPRFFIPLVVDELAQKFIVFCHTKEGSIQFAKDAIGGERKGLLLQTATFSTMAKEFLARNGVPANQLVLHALSNEGIDALETKFYDEKSADPRRMRIFAVSYPAQYLQLAKAFWQHTGFGISSRCAEYWLGVLDFMTATGTIKKHDLPLEEARHCKQTINDRIARLVTTQDCSVTPGDVWLFSTGMSAIAHTAMAMTGMKGHKLCNIAVFGFLYVDTFKVLTTVLDLSYTLYGHASPNEIDLLAISLSQGASIDALYLEFPGNPLLSSPDLLRLRALSIEFNFLLIVDDTVGTFVNISILPECDIICTSLTKMFSGACNVMGGSVVLNPQGKSYHRLSCHLTSQFQDSYFPLDAIIMETNSRDFASRVQRASANAELISDMISSHHTVSRVYYPKNNPSKSTYDHFKRPGAGYGFLISIVFNEPVYAIAFYNAIDVAKGPSLGTNFTLCCAYTLLAHYSELAWAAEHGVVEHLVRISIGVEDFHLLKSAVLQALEAASNAASSLSISTAGGHDTSGVHVNKTASI